MELKVVPRITKPKIEVQLQWRGRGKLMITNFQLLFLSLNLLKSPGFIMVGVVMTNFQTQI